MHVVTNSLNTRLQIEIVGGSLVANREPMKETERTCKLQIGDWNPEPSCSQETSCTTALPDLKPQF